MPLLTAHFIIFLWINSPALDSRAVYYNNIFCARPCPITNPKYQP